MASQHARGKQLIEEKKLDEAIVALTSALKESPASPVYLTTRALAYQRNKQYQEALADADAAVVYAHKRAKRELIIDAQLRRGIVLYNLHRYGDARAVFDIVKRMKEDVKEVSMWSGQIDYKVKTLGEDHEQMQVTVKEIPELDAEALRVGEKGPQASNTNGAPTPAPTATASASAPAHAHAPAAVQQTPVDKIRTDWYQNNLNVYLTLLARGVPADKTQIDITERSLNVTFPVGASGSTYDFTVDPLFAAVNPANCITRIMPTKVEIILSKATPGQKWHALESSEPVAADTPFASTAAPSSATDAPKPTTFTAAPTTGPVYPTSSKSGPKNWDTIAADGDNEDEDDGANSFFKKLYKDAAPEVQRAMMKSYTESNGTSLSTNWEEVSKGKVETLPPDGMEAKTWGK
jgi:suppressor of G2 allele of SKP1